MPTEATLFVLYFPNDLQDHSKAPKTKAPKAKAPNAPKAPKAKAPNAPKAPKATWKYKHMPEGWTCVGGGGTSDPRFPREEQFHGPRSTLPAMRAYLTRKFDALAAQKAVARYTIRAAYNGHPQSPQRTRTQRRSQRGKRAGLPDESSCSDDSCASSGSHNSSCSSSDSADSPTSDSDSDSDSD